jgi:hypothetical protein
VLVEVPTASSAAALVDADRDSPRTTTAQTPTARVAAITTVHALREGDVRTRATTLIHRPTIAPATTLHTAISAVFRAALRLDVSTLH